MTQALSELSQEVQNWLNEKYPSSNQYEPIFNVDYINRESCDIEFISIDSEQYPYNSSIPASLIIDLSQKFPNTEISINETQSNISIFMHLKEQA